MPIFENSLSTYPIAIGFCTLGPNVPLVISPMTLFSSLYILVFSLAIILFSGVMPTLIFLVPDSIASGSNVGQNFLGDVLGKIAPGDSYFNTVLIHGWYHFKQLFV